MNKKIFATLLLWQLISEADTNSSLNATFQQVTDENKNKVVKIMDSNINLSEFDKLINNELEKSQLNKLEKEIILEMFQNNDFKDEVYQKLKNENAYSQKNILLAIFFRIIYWIAYASTIIRIVRDWMEIDVRSFSLFWTSSLWMVFLNWVVPWSLVYFESFVLAFIAVWLELKNRKYRIKNYTEEQNDLWNDVLNLLPFPCSRYKDNWYPEIWNKKMNEETWYSHDDVIKYWSENWEVMSLLYKWDNFTKVQNYLKLLKETWEWYSDITFTLTTKEWIEKTFSWTTMPYEWWSIRIASIIKDNLEIQMKMKETENIIKELEKEKHELIRTDKKFNVLNSIAFEEDFIKIIKDNRNKEKYSVIMLDIDNFKEINDKNSHEFWDEILFNFIKHIQSKIRWNDWLYRLWWDEFALLMETENISYIVTKINFLRKNFYETDIKNENWQINVWSSWWIKTINKNDYIWTDDEIKSKFKNLKQEIDEYMYWVKYYKLIKDDLVKENKIEDFWENKNWIAEPVYKENKIIWIKITNNYWSFELSNNELEKIKEIKKNTSELRA